MQVSVETVSNIERRLLVDVPAERVDVEVNKRLQKASQTIRIDGFRPGKVPMRVIKQRYGSSVRQEVVGEVLRDTFYEALTQEKLQLAGTPNIEPQIDKAGEDLKYTATFEVYPEISLQDVSQLEVEQVVSEITDTDIETMIENLRKQHIEYVNVNRQAKDEDQLTIDFVGTQNGEEFSGGSAQDQKLILGSKSMIEGFEGGLLDSKAGDEKTLDLTFPEDYNSEELAGKEVRFVVTVKEIAEPSLPEIDAAFIEKFGVSDADESKFREEIRNNMERELTSALQAKTKSRIVDSLLAANQVDIPSGLLGEEIQRMKKEMVQQYGGGGQGFDASVLPDDLFKDQASKRVASGLLISQYIKDNSIRIEESRLDAKIEEMASTYQDPAEVIGYIKSNEQQMDQVRSLILEEQTIEMLLEKIQVVEVKKSYEDAIKPDEPPVSEEEAASEEVEAG